MYEITKDAIKSENLPKAAATSWYTDMCVLFKYSICESLVNI